MNNNVLQHFQGYELLIKTLDSGVDRFKRKGIPMVYGFVGLDSAGVIEKYLGNDVEYILFGGYDRAFSRFLAIGEDLDPADYVTCLRAHFNPKYNKITHRDVLGAVYNLGIDDRQFGDLWVEDDCIYIYVSKEMSSYFINNLTKVSRCSIQLEELDYFPEQVFRFKDFNITVSSYRLDKVLSAVIRKSREKAQKYIRSSMVNVNYQTIEDCDHLCNNMDILSVRGIGRFLIDEEIATTRSGNVIIRIRQFV